MPKHFAYFYDQLADKKGAKERANKVLKYIRKYHPQAKRILELGTGNGNVLASLSKKFELYGLDVEKRYLQLANKKVPKAHLFCSSMHNFSINKKFEVIFSIFDSINFLKNFEQWKLTFKMVSKHLNPGGLFIFDCYTPLMLKKAKEWTNFSKEPFGFMLDKGIVQGNKLIWDFKIFEKKNNLYQMHQNFFQERIFSITKIEKELRKHFLILEKVDGDNLKKVNKNTVRVLFVAKKL